MLLCDRQTPCNLRRSRYDRFAQMIRWPDAKYLGAGADNVSRFEMNEASFEEGLGCVRLLSGVVALFRTGLRQSLRARIFPSKPPVQDLFQLLKVQ